jgi:hypothetical protein
MNIAEPTPSASAEPPSRELRRRSSLVRQALRFVVLNIKILKLSRQHH